MNKEIKIEIHSIELDPEFKYIESIRLNDGYKIEFKNDHIKVGC